MFESFPHTADLGLRIQAASKRELFIDAARGLFSLLLADLDAVAMTKSEKFQIEAEDDEYLLLDWLDELIYAWHVRKMVFARFDVTLVPGGIEAVCYGEMLDSQKHTIDHDIKAVTYHGLQVKEDSGNWSAEVILDV